MCEFHFYEIYFRFGIYDLSMRVCCIKGIFVMSSGPWVYSVLVGELQTAWHWATLQTDFSSLTTHLFYKRQVGTCKRLHPLETHTHTHTHTRQQQQSKWLEVIEWLPVETFIDFHSCVNELSQLGSDGRSTNHKSPVFGQDQSGWFITKCLSDCGEVSDRFCERMTAKIEVNRGFFRSLKIWSVIKLSSFVYHHALLSSAEHKRRNFE